MAVGALLAFTMVLVATLWVDGSFSAVDSAVLRQTHRLASNSGSTVWALKAVSHVSVPSVYRTGITGVVVGLLLRGWTVSAMYLFTCTWLGLHIAPLLKDVFQRPRPQLPDPVAGSGGFSFPSGHALGVTVVALALALVISPMLRERRERRWVGCAVCAGVVSVGTARVVLGVHYLTDVLAGYAIGLVWVLAGALACLPLLEAEWSWHRSTLTPSAESGPAQ